MKIVLKSIMLSLRDSAEVRVAQTLGSEYRSPESVASGFKTHGESGLVLTPPALGSLHSQLQTRRAPPAGTPLAVVLGGAPVRLRRQLCSDPDAPGSEAVGVMGKSSSPGPCDSVGVSPQKSIFLCIVPHLSPHIETCVMFI